MKTIKDCYNGLISYLKKHVVRQTIQVTISVSFTVVTVLGMGATGISLYDRFVNRMEGMAVDSSEQLLDQTAINFASYLRNMRRVSDTLYYDAIKDKDLSDGAPDAEMGLLYEANKDSLISIACYTNTGKLVAAVPSSAKSAYPDIASQEWFTSALEDADNIHFSKPHAQSLFEQGEYHDYWALSLSRAVEFKSNGKAVPGVLLVDMNYRSIEQLLTKTNTSDSAGYVYLMDAAGELIYHPKQMLIYDNLYEENNFEAAGYGDGCRKEEFQGEMRLVTVKTVGYTDWKIVSVVPMRSFKIGLFETRQFAFLFVSMSIFMVVVVNQLVSARIAQPLQKLNKSVKEWEAGNLNPDIYVGGTVEVEHLGKTLRSAVEQLQKLMDDILVEQEEKRKSELDALQSQINPHFLYNTLESIVWMIEGGRHEDAVFMITQLASLFRISLSSGRTIITIEDEVKHAQNYMNIQKIRYKNSFDVSFEIDDDILDCCTVKLIIQPLLENAIYYGVEGMDGEGEIEVSGYRKGQDVYIEVRDNGLGMTDELVDALLVEGNRVRKKGSGVGVINVHNRIRLRFGSPYGLEIESHPDEGTTVRIHLPYIKHSPENVEKLESGRQGGKAGKEF